MTSHLVAAPRRSSLAAELVPPLILGSGSPRRAALLGALGVRFDTSVPGIDEPPLWTVDQLARAKFDHLIKRHPGRTILTADTLVLLGAIQLGKPTDRAHAQQMLRSCSGERITVLSAVCVGNDATPACHQHRSFVQLRPLTDQAIDDYLATGAADDKAGALALQKEAAHFIDTSAEWSHAPCSEGGCFSNVMGLPMCAVADLLNVERQPDLCAWPAA